MKKYGTVLSTGMTLAVGMTALQMLPIGDGETAGASTTYEYKVNTSVLNVRDKASTSGKKIGTVKQGEELTVSQTMGNGWLKIIYNGKVAYVSGEYVTKTAVSNSKPDVDPPTSTTKYEYIVNTDVLNVRASSSVNGRKLGTVKKGEKLTVQQTLSNGWHRINFNGKTGYVSGEYVTKKTITTNNPTPPPVTEGTNYEITKSDVNLRDKASWSGKSLLVIKKGTKVKAQKHDSAWMKVTYNGKTGYVSNEYVKALGTSVTPPPKPPEEVAPPTDNKKYEYTVTTTTLNVRSGTSTKHDIIGKVKLGEKLNVTETLIGWYKINYNGKVGYVSNGYVQKTEVKPSPEVPTPPPAQKETHEIVNENVNLRDQPSWSANPLLVIKKGSNVYAQNHNKDWMKVTYNGKTGYVSTDYIRVIGENPTPPPIVQPGEVTSYQQVDLRKQSNVTAQEINAYVDAYTNLTGRPSKISGKGQYIINIGREYGVNELFLAAIIVHESQYGTSYLAHFKNNLTGLNAFDSAPYDSAVRFSTVEESIRYAAQHIRGQYLNDTGVYNNGAFLGDKSAGMNVKYSSDALWGKKISDHMQKIKAFDQNYYDKQSISAANVNVSTTIPNYSDTYPSYTKAVANYAISLYDSKGGTKVRTLSVGEIFTPMEKTNDHYMKIMTQDGNVYWTSKLSISSYNTYFQFTNLVRVRNDKLGSVSLRKEANSASATVATVDNYSYLQLDVDKSTDNFYRVKHDNQSLWIEKTFAEKVYQ